MPGCLFRKKNSCISPREECAYEPVGFDFLSKLMYRESLTLLPEGIFECTYTNGSTTCRRTRCEDKIGKNYYECYSSAKGCIWTAQNICLTYNMNCSYAVVGLDDFEKKSYCE